MVLLAYSFIVQAEHNSDEKAFRLRHFKLFVRIAHHMILNDRSAYQQCRGLTGTGQEHYPKEDRMHHSLIHSSRHLPLQSAWFSKKISFKD